ncbi:tryptophan 7-halogenase [Luteolibacter flavescens]|uniref:Tryptophan 7-halogenase n=1 Tax=Luteolibacter flavescens TaxID=1859460 RepID=A0ABT3FV14_9BACT|nr:tryptophan 7-halogenase [Luteolibacter flavescens]MCW1887433.1 tryptophan 7-halogenase [Luteolibacter flavescens]
MIRSVLVLGGGSAGLLAALTLKRKLPALQVEVVASSRIGVIGVGEGTTPNVPAHLNGYLGIPERETQAALDPVFKLGVRFAWGRRDHFDYTFTGRQFAWRWPELPKTNGFYATEEPVGTDLASALMEAGKAAPRRADRYPELPPMGTQIAWHLENRSFVAWLESACQREGVTFRDAELAEAVRDAEGGIAELVFKDGTRTSADLYVDSSGFGSLLLGGALGESFTSFSGQLFCDRAVAGGWDRGDETILPYTLSETMPAGWAWRIDHPERIHRGYVFCSDHLSDDEAVAQYSQVAPLAKNPKIVKFRSGHYRNPWAHNVVAIGNAAGFVEPLEATALMVICLQARWLTDGLIDSGCKPPPTMRAHYCRMNRTLWETIRDFLAIHYRFNDRLETDFWLRCRRETDLGSAAELVDFYRENGASGIGASLLGAQDPFGLDSYLALLTGLRAPCEVTHTSSPAELAAWSERKAAFRKIAAGGLGMREVRQRLAEPSGWARVRGTQPASPSPKAAKVF